MARAHQRGERPLESRQDSEIERRGTVARFVRQGFRVALLYCLGGIALELLGPRLPPGTYTRAASFFYGLPGLVLRVTGLEVALTEAVLEGSLPTWLAAAAFPAMGVLLILAFSLVLGLAAAFVRMLLSLRQA